MNNAKPREYWIKDDKNQVSTMCDEHYRYCDTEVTIDPKCAENYLDFKNAIHVIEFSAYDQLMGIAIAMRKALIKRHEVFDKMRRCYYDTDKVLKECDKIMGPYNKMYEKCE